MDVLEPGGAFVAKVLAGGADAALGQAPPPRLRQGPARQAAGEPQGFLGEVPRRHRLPRPARGLIRPIRRFGRRFGRREGNARAERGLTWQSVEARITCTTTMPRCLSSRRRWCRNALGPHGRVRVETRTETVDTLAEALLEAEWSRSPGSRSGGRSRRPPAIRTEGDADHRAGSGRGARRGEAALPQGGYHIRRPAGRIGRDTGDPATQMPWSTRRGPLSSLRPRPCGRTQLPRKQG